MEVTERNKDLTASDALDDAKTNTSDQSGTGTDLTSVTSRPRPTPKKNWLKWLSDPWPFVEGLEREKGAVINGESDGLCWWGCD